MQTMPFGKHKGKPIRECPVNYLRWVLNNAQNITPALRAAIVDVLGSDADERIRRLLCPPPPAAALDRVIKSWYRDLSMRFHPDHRGGSTEAMTAINAARDHLKAVLNQVA